MLTILMVQPARVAAADDAGWLRGLLFNAVEVRRGDIAGTSGFKITPFSAPREDGFVLQVALGSGLSQPEPSSPDQVVPRKTTTSVSALGGWQTTLGAHHLTLLAGPEWSLASLTPNDPYRRDRGARLGARAEASLWLRPMPGSVVIVGAAASSTTRSFWVRAAPSIAFAAPAIGTMMLGTEVLLGPELMLSGAPDKAATRAGMHVTGLEFGGFWFALSTGWAWQREQRNSMYATFVSVRHF